MTRRERKQHATTDFPFPPAATGTWRGLSKAQREQWLLAARNRHFKWVERHGGWKDADPGTVFSIDGSAIADFPALLCALGEAINGPGGYFGLSMNALEDCLFGGFGVTLPFVLQIDDGDGCRRGLNARALEKWARERIASRDFVDEQGMQWLVDAELDGREGKRTLLDVVFEMLIFHGVAIDVTQHLP